MSQRRSNQTRRRGGVLLTRTQRGSIWLTLINGIKRCFSKKKNNNNNNNRNYDYMNGYGPSNNSFTAPTRSQHSNNNTILTPKNCNELRRSLRLARK